MTLTRSCTQFSVFIAIRTFCLLLTPSRWQTVAMLNDEYLLSSRPQTMHDGHNTQYFARNKNINFRLLIVISSPCPVCVAQNDFFHIFVFLFVHSRMMMSLNSVFRSAHSLQWNVYVPFFRSMSHGSIKSKQTNIMVPLERVRPEPDYFSVNKIFKI